MKQLKCLICGKEWYVDDVELNSVMVSDLVPSVLRGKYYCEGEKLK